MLPNRSLSHTKQKRPHSWRIPTRGYILQQGKNGTLGIHWGSAEKDTSSSEGLISSVYAFFPLLSSPLFALFLSFYPSVPPSPTVSVPPSGIVNLDLKVWFNVYCIVTLTSHDMTSIPAQKQPVAVVPRQSFFVCVHWCVHVRVCIKGIIPQY